MLGRPSDPADPIPGSALEIHDRENAQLSAGNRIEQSIRKSLAQSTPDRTMDDRARLRTFGDGFGTAPDLCDERRAKPSLFVLVVLGRVVEFVLSQFVESDVHRSDPTTSLAKYLVCRTARKSARFERRGSTLRFFGPDARILFRRQALQTFKQSFCQTGPTLGIEVQRCGLKFFKLHGQILRPSAILV